MDYFQGSLQSNVIISIYSTILSFFPTSYSEKDYPEYDIENGIQCTHIGSNIVYDAMVYLNNFSIARYGLTILKHVYLSAKRKNNTVLSQEVIKRYRELESHLNRPERNDLEDAKLLVERFKNDLDNNTLSFPSLPAHIYKKMREEN